MGCATDSMLKFADVYSKFFPPQVLVRDDGVVKLVNNEFHYVKSPNKNKSDLIILVGDYQGMTPEGQYELASKVLDVAKEFGVKKLFTLGGYGLGRAVKSPRVLGATTDIELVEEMAKYGITFIGPLLDISSGPILAEEESSANQHGGKDNGRDHY